MVFQSQNIFNHKLACKKCPLCQVLLLNDLELEWSQALRGLEGSASPAAHLQGGFLEQHSLAFQVAPASIAPAEDNTAGCYNSCLLHKINIFQNDIQQYSELLCHCTEVPLHWDMHKQHSSLNFLVLASGRRRMPAKSLSLAYNCHQLMDIRYICVMEGVLAWHNPNSGRS